jgi:Tfp pilus assembly protein PilF
MRYLTGLMILLMLLLAGCQWAAMSPPPPRPEPEPAAVSPPSGHLLASAEQALARDDLTGAEGYLERALRLDSRNPQLWHILAQTKYRQGDYPQTIQLCRRSNALLPPNALLRRDNLRLMAAAHRQLGEEEQARKLEAEL